MPFHFICHHTLYYIVDLTLAFMMSHGLPKDSE